MIKDEFKIAYSSICTPKELREKITTLESIKPKRKNNQIIQIASIAACLILVIAVFAFLPLNKATVILVDGQSVKDSAVTLNGANSASLLQARSEQPVTIPISIDVNDDCDISVSNGTMIITDIKSGDITMTDSKYSTDKKVSILWQNDMPDDDAVYNMTVKTQKECYTLTLKYNKSTDTRTVTCTKTN